MSLGLHEVSVPLFVKNLRALEKILAKGAAFAAEKGMAESELLQARLIEDMFPLVRQVQMTTDQAKGFGARVAGVAPLSFPDTEDSFDALRHRVVQTIRFLESLDVHDVNESLEKPFKFSIMDKYHYDFASGKDYFFDHALPNFFFHMTTAYGLLRMKGVAVGKGDFLGK